METSVMKKVFLGFLLLLVFTSTQVNVNAHSLLAPSVGSGVMEGKIDSYFFQASEWDGLAFNDSNPYRIYQYTAGYDGILNIWLDKSTSEPIPPLLYIKTPQMQEYVPFHNWPMSFVSAGETCSILLTSTTSQQNQAGELWYRLIYDDQTQTHSLVADFIVEPSNPKDYDIVTVTSTSQVEGASITGYTWTINGQPQPQLQDQTRFTIDQPQPGAYTVKLVVEDSIGYSDEYEYVFTVDTQRWFLIDAATCTGVQTTSPFEAVNRKTGFTSGDDVYLWLHLGNITSTLTVSLHWNSPDYTEKRQSTITIPDPQSQGYSLWDSYTVWDGVETTDSLYAEMMSTPGPWSVNAYANGEVIGSYTFNVGGDLTLSIETEGTKFITDETIPVSGQLTFSGTPLAGMTLKLSVYRGEYHLEDIGSVTTNSEGKFTASYRVPKVYLEASPKTNERWYIKVRNEYSPDYGLAEAETWVLIYPIWLNLDEVKLVQIIEQPVTTDWGGSVVFLAADRRAAARVFVTCPDLPFGFNQPEVAVKLSYGEVFGTDDIIAIEDSLRADTMDTWIDFFYTLKPGRFVLRVEVDPYHRYVDPVNEKTRVESQKQDITVVSKKMNTLSIGFVPIDLDDSQTLAPWLQHDYAFGVSNYSNMSPELKAAYLGYVRDQTEFMKDVFPLPDTYLDVKPYVYNYQVPMEAMTTASLNGRRYGMVSKLAKASFYENRKIVGVLPQSEYWWNKGPKTFEETGFSAWITYVPPIYQTQSALVMINSAMGVTAHEIGHTLGLNRWIEEYKISNWYLGKPVKLLAQKGDRIYDLSKDNERIALFKIKAKVANDAHCFMGSNPSGDFYPWICDETYPVLFDKLKDPPEVRVLFVSGQVINGLMTVDSTIEGSAVPDPEEDGRYTAECLDTGGVTLASYRFGGEEEELAFGFVMSFPRGTRRLVIRENGLLKAEVTPSLNKPEVTLGQVSLEGDTVHVDWEGSDMDGDELNYTVLFSSDNGETWQTIITEQQQETVSIKTGLLQGGDSCQLKVIAHDGFNTESVITGNFRVDPKPPEAFITAPEPGQAESASLSLQGFGYDLEDGFNVDSLTWSSSIDGHLGYGETLNVSLSTGTHVVTLKVTDSDGASATATVETTVSGESIFQVVDHIICRGVSEDGYPSSPDTVFTELETVCSYVNMTGMSVGDQVVWEFLGPGGLESSEQLTLQYEGSVYVYAYVELENFVDSTVGEWKVNVYVNGAHASTGFFDVEQGPSNSGWKIPFVGAPTILAVIALLIPIFKSRRGFSYS